MQIVLFSNIISDITRKEATGVGGWGTGDGNLTENGKRARVVEKRKNGTTKEMGNEFRFCSHFSFSRFPFLVISNI